MEIANCKIQLHREILKKLKIIQIYEIGNIKTLGRQVRRRGIVVMASPFGTKGLRFKTLGGKNILSKKKD